MSSLDKAVETQLANIEKRTGKSLKELTEIVQKCGLTKHGEIRDMLKKDLGMGHGDANTLVHYVQKSASHFAENKEAPEEDHLAAIYVGQKAAMRPIHEKLMQAIQAFGEFEIAPKKTYVSLRRKKQFCMIGPATNTRFEVGLNMKNATASDRLQEMPPKGMCTHKVKVSDVSEVNAELIAWIRQAFDAAG